MNFQQRVLITGASSGIGLELAKVFAKNGYNLILVARNQAKLASLKTQLEDNYKAQVRIIVKDLSLQEAANQLFSEVQTQKLEVDILINNAGFGEYGPFERTDWHKEKQMLDLNIVALTELTKLFLKPMLARKNGKILNVASTAAFQPGPLMSVYFATKVYVLHFSEAIAEELKGSGVQVTVLCPGATESNFQEVASMSQSKLFKRKIPSAAEVAEFAYRELFKGTRVAIHGFMNRIMAYTVGFLPRNLVTKLVYSMQSA
jgi:uncharacterized protein